MFSRHCLLSGKYVTSLTKITFKYVASVVNRISLRLKMRQSAAEDTTRIASLSLQQDGDTRIGSDPDSDIVLKGASVRPRYGQ